MIKSPTAVVYWLSLLLASFFLLNACADDPKYTQYKYNGRELYQANCQNCHKDDGKGLGRLIPPLAGADFLKQRDSVACIIKYGHSGKLTVNGVEYNQPMPANPDLNDLDIACIMTYIYNEWGAHEGLIGVKEVSQMLDDCPQGRKSK